MLKYNIIEWATIIKTIRNTKHHPLTCELNNLLNWIDTQRNNPCSHKEKIDVAIANFIIKYKRNLSSSQMR